MPADQVNVRDLLTKVSHADRVSRRAHSAAARTAIEAAARLPAGEILEVSVREDTGEVYLWARTRGGPGRTQLATAELALRVCDHSAKSCASSNWDATA